MSQMRGMAVRLNAPPIAVVMIAAALLPACGPVAQGEPQSRTMSLEEGMEFLADSLLPDMERAGIETLTVLDFEDVFGEPRILGAWLSGALSDQIVKSQDDLKLVERKALDELVKEHELLGTGLLDSTTAAKLGRFRGADAVVMGKVAVTGDAVLVIVQAISVETREHVSSASMSLPMSSVPETLLEPSQNERRAKTRRSGDSKAVLDTWEQKGLRVEALRVRRTPDLRTARVDLRLTNLRETDIFVGIEIESFARGAVFLKDEHPQDHLPIGDGRGSGISRVGKTAGKEDFTRLPPGETEISIAFRANENKVIHGDRFALSARLVLFEEGELARYTVDLQDLGLTED